MLKDSGVELEEMKLADCVVSPGHNPKESAEQFVQKFLRNQKSINKTIEIYEQK